MMEWNFNNETPIYLQIIDRFKMEIANGSLHFIHDDLDVFV